MSAWINVEFADDWEGLYVDGVLVDSNHSLHWPYLLESHPLPTSFKRELLTDDGTDALADGGLPERYEDIPPDYLEAQ